MNLKNLLSVIPPLLLLFPLQTSCRRQQPQPPQPTSKIREKSLENLKKLDKFSYRTARVVFSEYAALRRQQPAIKVFQPDFQTKVVDTVLAILAEEKRFFVDMERTTEEWASYKEDYVAFIRALDLKNEQDDEDEDVGIFSFQFGKNARDIIRSKVKQEYNSIKADLQHNAKSAHRVMAGMEAYRVMLMRTPIDLVNRLDGEEGLSEEERKQRRKYINAMELRLPYFIYKEDLGPDRVAVDIVNN